MSIGYGVTAGQVIRQYLLQQGFELIRPLADIKPYTDGSREARLRWVLRGYQRIVDAVIKHQPDLVFIFHSFNAFPAEVRRILLELGSPIPMVGYTHGSHWDPSDSERKAHYPGLEVLDLANLMALDQILFDSESIRSTVIDNVRSYSAATADLIAGKSRVVGLPIDTKYIDSHRSDKVFPRATVVFNHAPVPAKNPVEFIRVMRRVMPKFDINVLFTRAFSGGVEGSVEFAELREQFRDRVIAGNNMSLGDYYQALWMADIQVSTAFHESLGIATLEAMYTENCCLLPFRGSYPEICAGNRSVLYRNEHELEHRLGYFIANPEERRAVGMVLADQARIHSAAAIGPRIISAVEDALAEQHASARRAGGVGTSRSHGLAGSADM